MVAPEQEEEKESDFVASSAGGICAVAVPVVDGTFSAWAMSVWLSPLGGCVASSEPLLDATATGSR